jgi:hypothetical protein
MSSVLNTSSRESGSCISVYEDFYLNFLEHEGFCYLTIIAFKSSMMIVCPFRVGEIIMTCRPFLGKNSYKTHFRVNEHSTNIFLGYATLYKKPFK